MTKYHATYKVLTANGQTRIALQSLTKNTPKELNADQDVAEIMLDSSLASNVKRIRTCKELAERFATVTYDIRNGQSY